MLVEEEEVEKQERRMSRQTVKQDVWYAPNIDRRLTTAGQVLLKSAGYKQDDA